MKEVGEKIDGASDFVAVKAALAVIVEHGVPSGASPQPIGKIGVQNAIGGDNKIWVVRGKVHVGGREACGRCVDGDVRRLSALGWSGAPLGERLCEIRTLMARRIC